MVTNEEILQYLKAQPWFYKFKGRLCSKNKSNYGLLKYIKTVYLPNVIYYAFIWGSTTEGYDYWCEIDKSYREWLEEVEKKSLSI